MNYPVLQELPFDGTIYRNGHMNTLEAVLPPGAYTSPLPCAVGAAGRRPALRVVRRNI